MDKTFFNVKDLCKYIYLSDSTIYKMVMNENIPYHKVGNRLLFHKEEIDMWVLNGCTMVCVVPELPNII